MADARGVLGGIGLLYLSHMIRAERDDLSVGSQPHNLFGASAKGLGQEGDARVPAWFER